MVSLHVNRRFQSSGNRGWQPGKAGFLETRMADPSPAPPTVGRWRPGTKPMLTSRATAGIFLAHLPPRGQAAGPSSCRRQDQLIVDLVERHPKAPEKAHSEKPGLRQTRVHNERYSDVMSDHVTDP